jgi:hypothetical protein
VKSAENEKNMKTNIWCIMYFFISLSGCTFETTQPYEICSASSLSIMIQGHDRESIVEGKLTF